MENLTKEFRGFTAVRNLSLDVHRGTIHALIGPNGAGKTTVFNLATKFLSPTSGRVFFKGIDITRMAPAEVARLGMVRSFQISAGFANLTVRENVRYALQRFRKDGFFFWSPGGAAAELNGRAKALVNEGRLEVFAERKAIELPTAAGALRSPRRSRSTRSCCCSTSRCPTGTGGHRSYRGFDQKARPPAPS